LTTVRSAIRGILRFLLLWFVDTLALLGTAAILGGRGDFATTLRGMGFAASVFFLSLLAFIPAVGPLARFLVLVLAFFAAWMGAEAAHELRGWRSLLLPLLAVVVFFVGAFALEVLIAGADFALDALARNLGLAP
jgi:hypothetical protein